MAWSTGLVARTACPLLGYDSCSVPLPDPAHRVLAIEGARLWDREQRTALLERPALFEDADSGRPAAARPPRRRRATRSTAGRLLGAASAARGPAGHRGGRGGEDRRAVEHASAVAALETPRERTAVDVEWLLCGGLLTDLLTQQPTAMAIGQTPCPAVFAAGADPITSTGADAPAPHRPGPSRSTRERAHSHGRSTPPHPEQTN
ncbi:hypothetical protein [Streptomyces olivaceoviridis]|uniref:hypothetical protein n=1 Tax=Streptomyces olivaceoviridis TaxID=1921 RepID=UPI0036F9E3CE